MGPPFLISFDPGQEWRPKGRRQVLWIYAPGGWPAIHNGAYDLLRQECKKIQVKDVRQSLEGEDGCTLQKEGPLPAAAYEKSPLARKIPIATAGARQRKASLSQPPPPGAPLPSPSKPGLRVRLALSRHPCTTAPRSTLSWLFRQHRPCAEERKKTEIKSLTARTLAALGQQQPEVAGTTRYFWVFAACFFFFFRFFSSPTRIARSVPADVAATFRFDFWRFFCPAPAHRRRRDNAGSPPKHPKSAMTEGGNTRSHVRRRPLSLNSLRGEARPRDERGRATEPGKLLRNCATQLTNKCAR